MESKNTFSDSIQGDILDAFPSAILILDEDARVQGLNSAAQAFLGLDVSADLRRRCGEVLQCLNEHNSQEVCGKTDRCPKCVIRQGLQVLQGGPAVTRKRYDMDVLRGEECQSVVFWVTASLLETGQERFALLVLEDITELVRLRDLVPICANCKKIRTEDAYWEQVEEYMGRYLDLTFTHSICPECVEKFYGNLPLDGPGSG